MPDSTDASCQSSVEPGFRSILSPGSSAGAQAEPRTAPPFFHDLNLDQVVNAITAAWKDYDLSPFFFARPDGLDAILYRQAVMRELEEQDLRDIIGSFSERMRTMRQYLGLAEKRYYRYEKQRWFLDAAETYVLGLERLGLDLSRRELKSTGLRRFCRYLTDHLASPPFRRLSETVKRIKSDLSAITYGLLIKGNSVTVRPLTGEPDYSEAVERTFEKFRRRAASDYRAKFTDSAGLNHVEAEVLERVARLHPETFQALESFSVEQVEYQDPTILRFDREIQFYFAYLGYFQRFRQAGLSFCYPELSASSKEIDVRGGFDLALADRLLRENKPVIPNDFFFRGPERIFVVSGPNQGGKTTFARMFGQLHYLASLGCPVPASRARLFLFDRMYTHFERQEDVENLRGKLLDDLVRIKEIVEQATPASIVIINEIFLSTTLKDAVSLSKQVMARLSALDLLGVCVTFLTELTSFDRKTVSLVGGVDPQDPTIRTFRLERRPANGLAYARALAEKRRLTYGQLKERIRA